MVRTAFVGLALVLLIGCSSKAGPPGDGGTLDGGVADGGVADGGVADGGHRCASDAECAPLVCDFGSGACVQRPPCTSDAQCTGAVCNTCNSTCESVDGGACVEDVNCNILVAFCDPCVKRCRPLRGLCEPCAEDRQCGTGDGNKCLTFDGGARACGRSCEVIGCPLGYVCTDEAGGGKQCRPCAGSCGAPGACSRDADCPFRNFCNAGPGICPVCTPGCTGDLSCSGGQRCHDNGRCAPACPGTACPTGYVCTDGRCVLPGSCLTNADCRDDPNPPNYCDLTSNRCVPGCDEDNDCLPVAQTQGSLCDKPNRRCVQRPCGGTFACGFQQFCVGGQCQPAGGAYCKTCQQDTDCNCETGATCPSGPNYCLEFQDGDGGVLGKFCMLGGCNPDGGAETGCPQGYACTELPTPDGQSSFNGCFRHCWEPVQ